jgi:predicted kinase
MQQAITALSVLPSALATDQTTPEGFVLRVAGAFTHVHFGASLMKYVRANHVQTGKEWKRSWVKTLIDRSKTLDNQANVLRYQAVFQQPQKQQSTGREAKTRSKSKSRSRSRTPPKKQSKADKKAARAAEQLVAARKRRTAAAPQLLILVGLPGSGKSTFCRMLEDAKSGWKWVSKDALGSRAAAEAAVSGVLNSGKSKRRQAHGETPVKNVAIDMCNASEADRKAWCRFSLLDRKQVGVVYFETDAEECIQRAMLRANSEQGHESGDLFQWGGRTAIMSHAKRLQIPAVTPTNAGYDRVYVIGSEAEMEATVLKLGGLYNTKHVPTTAATIDES